MLLPKLSPTPTHDEVQAVFRYYAQAYALMECIQKPGKQSSTSPRLLPTGDQKTGCIGEYWAMRYARAFWNGLKEDNFSFGHHSQKGWDIEVKIHQEETRYIQVKTASEFGKGGLGAIRQPDASVREKRGKRLPDYWDELWIIHLDQAFLPIGFWRIEGPHRIVWSDATAPAESADLRDGALRVLRGKKVSSLAGIQTPSWLTGPVSNQIAEFRSRMSLPPL